MKLRQSLEDFKPFNLSQHSCTLVLVKYRDKIELDCSGLSTSTLLSIYLSSIAGTIRGRSTRIGDVVSAEMDNYEPGYYTEKVLEAVKVLRNEFIPMFNNQVTSAVTALVSNPPGAVDENEFIDASRLVYDGVREVRRAVLMNRGEEEIDTDTEWDDFEEGSEVGSNRPLVESRQDNVIDEYPDISGITTAREAMKKLPEAERLKIAEQVEEFRSERVKFDREVSKWDDQGN